MAFEAARRGVAALDARLEKVRDLANWPTALEALRVCPARLEDGGNCGKCEKCLRTRLELLAAGVEQTSALGPSLTPVELWEEAVPAPTSHRAIMYEDLYQPCKRGGLPHCVEFSRTGLPPIGSEPGQRWMEQSSERLCLRLSLQKPELP